MKKFEEFLNKGIVKKGMPNENRALSILKEAEGKKEYLELSMKMIPKTRPNFIADYCYDILMELIRAKMYLDGYNAGNSYEAEVSYMSKLGFQESEIQFMDELRYYRNGIKYYGTILDEDYAKKALAFMQKNYPKLRKLFG